MVILPKLTFALGQQPEDLNDLTQTIYDILGIQMMVDEFAYIAPKEHGSTRWEVYLIPQDPAVVIPKSKQEMFSAVCLAWAAGRKIGMDFEWSV
jgi:hypothetical protein